MQEHNDHAVRDILAELQAMCPDFDGAVVSTGDGLVLAASGAYQGDAPAACAASMFVHLQDDLRPLQDAGDVSGFQDLLVFGERRLWFLARLASRHLLLIGSHQVANAGAVRLAGRVAVVRLNDWLAAAA